MECTGYSGSFCCLFEQNVMRIPCCLLQMQFLSGKVIVKQVTVSLEATVKMNRKEPQGLEEIVSDLNPACPFQEYVDADRCCSFVTS